MGRLISVDGCEECLEDIDEIEFGRSEDEDEEASWTRGRMGRTSIYEELAGLDYFSAGTASKAKSAYHVDPQDGEHEDNMPISELIKVRSQQVRKLPTADAQAGWETSTQTPSVLSVGRPHQATRVVPWAMMEACQMPNHRPWEGRPVYAPPGHQLKELLPGGAEIIGPAVRPNPFKTQFDEMLRVLQDQK